MLSNCGSRKDSRVPWTIRSNQSIPKEINSEYSLEGLTLKLQYFGHLMRRADSPERTLMMGKTEGKRKRGWQENEMVRWHHWLNGRESEQTPGDSEGQGGLACCSSWGCNVMDTTERLNNNNNPYQCGLGIHIHVLLQKYYMFHYGVLPQIPLEEWSITHVWFYSLSEVLQILNSEMYLAPSKVWIRDWGPV